MRNSLNHSPLVLLFLIGWAFVPAQAVRLYVNAETGDDRRSIQAAQSKTTPLRSISHAIQIAHLFNKGKPHQIDIAAGTYSPSTTAESYPIKISDRDISIRTDGNVTMDAEHKTSFFELTTADINLVLRNFAFTNAHADSGGVVSCHSCTLRIVDNQFSGNVANIGGDLVHMRGGKLNFSNNLMHNNGQLGHGAGLIKIDKETADTSSSYSIRNNTFFNNNSVNIVTADDHIDISNNIFSGGVEPAIVDLSSLNDPLVRYNMFWNLDLLYTSDTADSVKVVKTVRDTLTLEKQGVKVPDFFTNAPDTVAQVGIEYKYAISVEGDSSYYIFNPLKVPLDASAKLIEDNHIIRFTPTIADTGSHEVLVEVFPPGGGSNDFLNYRIQVFKTEDFPDTTNKEPQVNITFVSDTTGAETGLNALVPVFSSAASAGGNLIANPKFFDTTVLRFELDQTSPARDSGNPIVAMRDNDASGTGPRNDMGKFGGPLTVGPPNPGSYTELLITSLPDTIAVIGETFTYTPVLKPNVDVIHVDFLRGPSGLMDVKGSPPLSWTASEADTGKYFVVAQVFSHTGNAHHVFSLRVKPDNEPPFITSSAPTDAFEDSVFSYTVTANDVDGDPITFSIVNGPKGMTLDSSGVLNWLPTQNDVGIVPVEISVTDTNQSSRSQVFNVTVSNTNDRPVLSTILDTIIFEDVAFSLFLGDLGTDIDPLDTLSYALTKAPQSAIIDSLNNLIWTPMQSDVGIHSMTVQVRDLAGAEDTSHFALTVVEIDDPPVISSTPDTIAFEDALFNYKFTSVDEEGAQLTYTVESGPAAMTIDSTGTVSWTPTAADTGKFSVSLQAADPAGQAVTQSFVLNVHEVNDAPVLVRTPSDSLLFTDPGLQLSLSVSATDEESDQLNFTWLVNNITQIGKSESAFSLTPDSTGIDTVTVQVFDLQDTTATSWIVDGRRLARIRTIAESIDFGDVALGDTGSAVINVVNIGNANLKMSNLRVDNLAFSAVFGRGNVAAGDSTTLELSFVPTAQGPQSSNIAFATNDSNRMEIIVGIIGTGVQFIVGDFDHDGDVDLNDFFRFAENFGRVQGEADFKPIFDIDNNNSVDLDDFYLFADNFTGAAKIVASHQEYDISNFRVAVDSAPDSPDFVTLSLNWIGKEALHGFMTEFEFDPTVLEFVRYQAIESHEPLVWTRSQSDGHQSIAVGLSTRQGPFRGQRIGMVDFKRLKPSATEIRVSPVLALVDHEKHQTLAIPSPAAVSVSPLPSKITLNAPYPNPFNPITIVSFFLPKSNFVQLKVFDLLGRTIQSHNQHFDRGFNHWLWNGRDKSGVNVAAGVYLISFSTSQFEQFYKVTLLK